MLRKSLTILSALILAVAIGLSAPTEVQAQERPGEHAGYDRSEQTMDSTGLRVGLLLNVMLASEKPIAFRYFDLGLRHKSGEYYVDIRAPALMVIGDAIFAFSKLMMGFEPRLLLQSMNSSDIASYWELAHARLGYRFRIVPPGDFELWENDLEAAVGVFATADIIFFDMRANLEEDQNLSSLGYTDPFVVGIGGFFAIGNSTENVQYDVALGIGQALPPIDSSAERPVTLALIDADFQYELGLRNVAIYVRPRLSGYFTQLSPRLTIGAGITTGVNIGF